MNYLSEEELIAYAKDYLKQRGFKKKNKRWTKVSGIFTLCFYIQGSCWDKNDYYIRPGIFINGLEKSGLSYYGHFWLTIDNTLPPDKIFDEFEKFCTEWTNIPLIKDRAEKHQAWIERNPLDKRRAGLVDYDKDPRSDILIKCSDIIIEYLINKL